MPEDAYDQNSVDVGLSLDMIEEEIEAGLPMHADRLTRAYVCEEYYACRNAAFIRPRTSEDWIDFINRPKRTSKLTRKVVRKLCEHLYAPGPTRKLEGNPGADELLQDLYVKNQVNARLQQADRKATLNGACAIGAVATGKPEKPIRLDVWGAHEFVAWTWPDDPTEVWALCTIGRERKVLRGRLVERLRFEAWSMHEHRVYFTQWQDCLPETTLDWARQSYRCLFGRPATFDVEESTIVEDGAFRVGVNPYGCVPFTLISDETRVSGLFEGGIGDALVECNAEIDRELSDLAAHVKEFMDPDRFTRNVSSTFRRERNRGRWQELPATAAGKTGDDAKEPDAFLVQATLAVEQVWGNIKAYADATIEELDVPLVAVRMDAATDLSGVAIVAKQLPLLQRTKQRQQDPFTQHETDLAGMVLTVYGTYYGEPAIAAAGKDPRLTLIWPEPSFPLPTPERDAEDQADLEAGRKSLVQIVAERNGVTAEQAKQHLERVIDDNVWYADLLKRKGVAPEPEPPSQLPANPGEQTPPDEQEPPPSEEDDEL